MKSIDIKNLAVMFRTNDPNLGHASVLEAMSELGLAYMYGVYRGTPERYWKERKRLRDSIAMILSQKARQS